MTEFLDAQYFGESLTSELSRCTRFRAVVSYIRTSGISALLNTSATQVEHSIIITCTDFGITEPQALSALIQHGYNIRAFKEPGLHAKVWLLEFPHQDPVMFVGSSNLSGAAVSRNIEANVRVVRPDAIAKASAWFNGLTRDENAVKVDRQWIEEYQALRDLSPPRERFVPPAKITEPSRLPENVALNAESPIVDQRINANGRWYERRANPGDTFQTQGIPEGLARIDCSGLPTRGHVSGVRLILLENNQIGNLVIFKDIRKNTLNASRQLGTNRDQVLRWIGLVWGTRESFSYEVAIATYEGEPTIWLRPKRELSAT